MFDRNNDMDENQRDNRDSKNNSLKDSFPSSVHYKRTAIMADLYPKLNKLITALYMVTDIMDNTEPLRLKLRTLGVEILSDIRLSSRSGLKDKIESTLEFLGIARTINLISAMNVAILEKEFTELHQALISFEQKNQIDPAWLEEFLQPANPLHTLPENNPTSGLESKNILNSRGDSTVSKDEVLSRELKDERRKDIIKAIQDNGGSATITEIRAKIQNRVPGPISTYSEKTLQRELIRMVQDGVLTKIGEKRWSRYYTKG